MSLGMNWFSELLKPMVNMKKRWNTRKMKKKEEKEDKFNNGINT